MELSSQSNHWWHYWTTNDNPLPWQPAGGADGAYARAPLSALVLWQGGYYPIYSVGMSNAMSREAYEDPYLTSNTIVRVAVNGFTGLDLKGGSLRMFIGVWNSSNTYAFFYHTNALTLGDNAWVTNTFRIGGAEG